MRSNDWQTLQMEKPYISASPEKAIEYLKTVFTPLPGIVIGRGTIPDCTGPDNDLWINPGKKIEIIFDKLGILRPNMPEALDKMEQSRRGNPVSET